MNVASSADNGKIQRISFTSFKTAHDSQINQESEFTTQDDLKNGLKCFTTLWG